MLKKTLRRLLACVMAVMLCMAAIPVPVFAEGGDYYDSELPPEENPMLENPDTLIPEGNMDLVSDITGEAANGKEFLTVVSKNGNYFYIIIDRSGTGNNTVHFLNQVDEADLLSLLSEDEREEYTQSKPEPTPEPTPSPTPEPEAPVDSGEKDTARAGLLIVLFGALGVLVFLYLRSKKAAAPAKGGADLDDYDFGDDEDEDDDLYAKFKKYDPDSEVDGS